MKLLKEFIVVKVPDVFNEATRFKGMNGKQIIMSALSDPVNIVRCFGEVVGVPESLTNAPLFSRPLGLPGYSQDAPFWYAKASDIEMEIKVGDKAYFHYSQLMPDIGVNVYNHNFLGSEKIDGKMWHYFRVKYETVFAVVRYEKTLESHRDFDWSMEDKLKKNVVGKEELYFYNEEAPKPWGEYIYRKKVVMIGSWVFVKFDKEDWKDISIPIPMMVNGKILLDDKGKAQMKPESQWLVTKRAPGNQYLKGWIAHIGSPLKGDNRHHQLYPGMYVYFRRLTDTPLKFEGQEFWRMRQNYISMVNPAKFKDPNEQVSETKIIAGES